MVIRSIVFYFMLLSCFQVFSQEAKDSNITSSEEFVFVQHRDSVSELLLNDEKLEVLSIKVDSIFTGIRKNTYSFRSYDKENNKVATGVFEIFHDNEKKDYPSLLNYKTFKENGFRVRILGISQYNKSGQSVTSYTCYYNTVPCFIHYRASNLDEFGTTRTFSGEEYRQLTIRP